MAMTPQIKAAAITAAVYAATGIQPVIINRPGQPPLITFNRADSAKVNDFIKKSLETKSDVNIDFYPYIAPVILEQLFFPIFLGIVGAGAVGFLLGKANPF